MSKQLLFTPVVRFSIILVNPDTAIHHTNQGYVFTQEVGNDLVVAANFNDSVLLEVVGAVEHDAVFVFVDKREPSGMQVEPKGRRKLVRKCFSGRSIRVLAVDRHFLVILKHYCNPLFFQELELNRLLFERVFLIQLNFSVFHFKYPEHFISIYSVKLQFFMLYLINISIIPFILISILAYILQVSLANHMTRCDQSVF